MSVRNTVKSIQDVMRQDTGVDGDAQRISQLCWMFFLKIPSLRRFILGLAVRGKLVEQDSRDEPACELLKRVNTEKERLAKKGKTVRSQARRLAADSEVPFQLPRGWVWGRIEDVFTSVSDGDHQPPPKTETGIPFLVIGNVRHQLIDFVGCRHVDESYYHALDDIHRPMMGDLLYTLVGSYGIPVIVRDDRAFCVQRHIGILRPSRHVDVGFLARVLESDFVLDQATGCATGIAQKTVPLSGLRRLVLPLPPFAEQIRIAAKVDELMALCDRLEAAQAERERRRDGLAGASLQRLNEPADPATFREHANFHLRNFQRFTTRPDQIPAMREAILNLAVRGQLVPTSDWPTKPEPLGEFAALQNGYAFKSEWFVRSGIRLLRNANVGHGLIRWDDLECLPEDRAQEFERFQLNVR